MLLPTSYRVSGHRREGPVGESLLSDLGRGLACSAFLRFELFTDTALTSSLTTQCTDSGEWAVALAVSAHRSVSLSTPRSLQLFIHSYGRLFSLDVASLVSWTSSFVDVRIRWVPARSAGLVVFWRDR